MHKKSIFLLVFMMAACLSSIAIANTYTVTNTNDSGSGSLRQALFDANTNVGADTIIFNIPTSDPNYNAALGVWTIAPLSGLPTFSDDSTKIDGTSQSAFVGSDPNPNGPEIELDGTNAGDVDGFYVLSSNNIIKGLVINRFKHFGIQITFDDAHHNIVSGCYIGIDVTGTMDSGNGFSGIILYNGAKKNVIGGNKIAEHNVVSGNDWSGVEIQSSNADSNIVIGNYIGTDAAGSKDLGNSSYGVYIWSGARGNIVGGITPEDRNIISANHWDGVAIVGPATDYNIAIGNYIGTNWNGTEPLANGFNGIAIGSGNKHNLIGGTIVCQGNLVSGNGNYGIGVFGSTDNIIAGNTIGTDPTGVIILGNKNCGISLSWGSHNNTVGPDNVIGNNGSDGIRVENDTTIVNTITQNFITNNSGLGIENIDGGNTELQPPIISAVTSTSVSGTALPNSMVEIFSDGEDEGGIFEGQVLS
ncbi:MAG TPA: right-handed parallel beta-helix repeat-containing protein, partial [bacterium]